MSIICFLVCLIIIEELAEFFYKRSSMYKKVLGGADRLRAVPNGIEICNIGSGPGLYAISYDEIEKKGYNFSTAPQTFKYGYRILEHFSSKIKREAIVIIIIMCPLSFGDNIDTKRKDYSDKYYGILKKNEIEDFSWVRACMLRHPLIIKAINKYKRKREMNTPLFTDEPDIITIWKNEFLLKDLFDCNQAKNHENAMKEKRDIVCDILDLCKKNGWKPFFVVPPIPVKTKSYISDDFADVFVFNNLKIINEKENIPILDYFHNNIFTEDCFSGDIFMNEKGRKLFSQNLFRDIERIINGIL